MRWGERWVLETLLTVQSKHELMNATSSRSSFHYSSHVQCSQVFGPGAEKTETFQAADFFAKTFHDYKNFPGSITTLGFPPLV